MLLAEDEDEADLGYQLYKQYWERKLNPPPPLEVKKTWRQKQLEKLKLPNLAETINTNFAYLAEQKLEDEEDQEEEEGEVGGGGEKRKTSVPFHELATLSYVPHTVPVSALYASTDSQHRSTAPASSPGQVNQSTAHMTPVTIATGPASVAAPASPSPKVTVPTLVPTGTRPNMYTVQNLEVPSVGGANIPRSASQPLQVPQSPATLSTVDEDHRSRSFSASFEVEHEGSRGRTQSLSSQQSESSSNYSLNASSLDRFTADGSQTSINIPFDQSAPSPYFSNQSNPQVLVSQPEATYLVSQSASSSTNQSNSYATAANTLSGCDKTLALPSHSMGDPDISKENKNMSSASQDSTGYDFASKFLPIYRAHKLFVAEENLYVAQKTYFREVAKFQQQQEQAEEAEQMRRRSSEVDPDSETRAAPVWCLACQDNLVLAGCGDGRIEVGPKG